MDSSLYIAKRILGKTNTGFTRVIANVAVATIALSIAMIICSNALISGFKYEIANKIYGFWGHIHITDTKITRNYENIPIKLDNDLMNKIESMEKTSLEDEITGEVFHSKGGVSHIQPYVFTPCILSVKSTIEAIVLKGVDDSYNWTTMRQFIKRGEPMAFQDTVASRDIIISEQTANKLEVDTGAFVIINFYQDRKSIKKRFKVSGIYRTGLEEYDSKIAFCDLRLVQNVLGWESDQIVGYEIFLDDISDANLYAESIYQNYLPRGNFAETIQEKNPRIFEWLELQNINERIVMLLMILVAIINIATVILIFILDRSHMIGILKSVGASDWNIRKIFIYNAFWILLKGAFWGNVIGIGFCVAQKYGKFIKLDEASYYLSIAPIKLSLISLLLINLLMILVTAIWMIVPTVIITKIKPVKVLRFE